MDKALLEHIRAARAANEDDFEREPVEEVFMCVPSAKANGKERVYRIPLVNGVADISEVPLHVRTNWEMLGERTSVSVGSTPPTFVLPRDGARFLDALLRKGVTSSGVYFRGPLDNR